MFKLVFISSAQCKLNCLYLIKQLLPWRQNVKEDGDGVQLFKSTQILKISFKHYIPFRVESCSSHMYLRLIILRKNNKIQPGIVWSQCILIGHERASRLQRPLSQLSHLWRDVHKTRLQL